MIKIGRLLKEVASQYKIYCDLDSVLVDFTKGYIDLTGKEPPSYESKFDKKEFWRPIDKSGGEFWSNLEWMEDGHELWNFIAPYNPEILSSPSNSQTSVVGKEEWMIKNLPGVKLNLEQSEKKQVYAEPNAILIDDRDTIIERWNNAGGIGILHTSAENTIKQLKELGFE